MEIEEIQINEVKLSIKSKINTAGPVYLLIHGWPESSDSWLDISEELIKAGASVIIPDLRGMGESERDLNVESYAKDRLAEDLFQLLDHYNVEQVHIVGHDWGAAIAQEMCLLQPERFLYHTSISMFSINNAIGNIQAARYFSKQAKDVFWYRSVQQESNLAEKILKGKEEEWISHILEMGSLKSFPKKLQQTLIDLFKKEGSITSYANFYRSLDMDRKRYSSFRSRKITVPTTFIYGEHDPVIKQLHFENIEACYEEVKVQQLNGAHFLLQDCTNEIINYLKPKVNVEISSIH